MSALSAPVVGLSLALLLASGAVANTHDDDDYREDLQLQCYGEAEKTTVENHSGVEWDHDKHKYVSKSTLETGKTDFETAITVSIHGDSGQVRIPKALIPPLHSGGNDGWWDIDDLIVGHNEIRGQFRLNALNKPTLVISRRSGVMTIEGLIKFTGRCEPDDGHRRF